MNICDEIQNGFNLIHPIVVKYLTQKPQMSVRKIMESADHRVHPYSRAVVWSVTKAEIKIIYIL